MNLLELLRLQARRFRCPACGASMADCGISIVAQQGATALVRVTCASCRDENLLQVIVAGDLPVERRPRGVLEPRPQLAQPIEADELIDLHTLLRDHQGDLVSLLRRPRD